MPSYRIRHATKYHYQEPVSVCHNLAHLMPRPVPRHAWRRAELDISPMPAVRSQRTDYFGNLLTFFGIQEPHRQLEVTSHVIVDIDAMPAVAIESSPAWETVRDRFSQWQFRPLPPALLDPYQFTFPSPYVQLSPDVTAFASESFAPERPILEAANDLAHRIHTQLRYDLQSTTISTTLPEILQARAGVCQDFAHLFIGAARSVRLPARYVSGYLLTTPPPGQAKLTGADASHAWASVFVPGDTPEGGSWVDFDPTNNCIPSDKHITLAWGRDFGDVSPLRGVVLGGGQHTVHVAVDVVNAA